MEKCSCAGWPPPPAPPSLLARYEAQLRALVRQVLADVQTLACAIAKATLRGAIQTFVDGVAVECPECMPFIFPLATALYLAAVREVGC